MHATPPESLPRVHLGCGLTTPEDWINVDGSWNARLARYPRIREALLRAKLLPASLDVAWSKDIVIHDLRRTLPFRSGSIGAIYSSHTLEHLYLNEARRLLVECQRVLAPGGVARFVVPDLRAIVEDYVAGKGDPKQGAPADLLNERLLLRGVSPPPRNPLLRWYLATADFNSHKWMYDAFALCRRMAEAGFVDVGEMPFHKSRIRGIESVELADRVLNGAGICVEGIRPRK